MESNIKVSCVCLTRNRRSMLANAIESWEKQSFPREQMELLVVNDLDADDIKDLVTGKSHVRLLVLPKLVIGAKRNRANGAARGEIIIHVDDDDYHGIDRVSHQVEFLIKSNLSVVGYNEFKAMKIGSERAEWIYKLYPSPHSTPYSCGGGLCYFREFWEAHKFSDGVHIGEDAGFVNKAQRAKQLTVCAANDDYIVGIHPGNTIAKPLNSAPWRRI